MGLSVAVTRRALVDGFRAVVGPAHARDDTATREAAAVDGVVPHLVVAPASTDEVAGAMALAAAEGLAVVPRGSGSAFDQGVPAARVDVVLDLSRLDRILEYNPDDLTVTAEAGVTGAALAAALHRRRQFLAIDPPAAATRTLGGLVATNASGPLRARYGTARDLLLGVRFVQADGVVTWGGSKVVKSVTGYDVPKLMVGSLGTLGVLTELTLRLHSCAEVERTTLIGLPSAPASQAFIARVLDSPLQPNRLEALGAAALDGAGGPTAAAGIAVCFGSVEAAVQEQEAEVVRLARSAGASIVTAPSDFWATYGRLWVRDDGATLLTVGGLPARIADTLEAVAEATAPLGHDARVVTGGCAMVGSFRVLVAGATTSGIVGFIERLRAVVATWDGTVMVQGAPRAVRAAVDPWGPVPADVLAVMRAIKSTFDPERRLNPGRFVGGL